MRTSNAIEANHLRERAAEMRGSSKELKDSATAAVLMRLADLYDRLAARAEASKRACWRPCKRSGMIRLHLVKAELLSVRFPRDPLLELRRDLLKPPLGLFGSIPIGFDALFQLR
jgi:hypothetical protein